METKLHRIKKAISWLHGQSIISKPWATIAASLDIPEDTIALALGHSSAHTTTAIYIERKLSKVDAANRKVLDLFL